jgi:hypothetical protein
MEKLEKILKDRQETSFNPSFFNEKSKSKKLSKVLTDFLLITVPLGLLILFITALW